MRVPNISTYTSSTYRLGLLTSDLENANEIAGLQKRLNEISDDPLGLSQVLTLQNSLGNLEQIEENVTMGKSWLDTVETALDSINTLILEAKTEVTRLANDSTTADERYNAIERINSMIDQVVTLGNTQVNGSYVFAGTDTDVRPFEHDRDGDPEQVIYNGNNDPFEIRTDRNLGVEVGRDGEKTLWDDEIEINSLNNTIVFKEDLDRGSAFEKILTATVPDGIYSVEDLGRTIRNVLNDASSKEGYQVSYLVDYDAEQRKFTIQADGSYDGFIQTTFLWKDGGDAYLDEIKVGNGIDPEDIDVSVLNTNALTIATPVEEQGEPIRFVWDGDEHWIVENNPGYIIPSKIEGTSMGFELDLTESGTADISVRLGTAAPAEEGYIEFGIVTEKGDHSISHEIGFSGGNTISTSPVSDTQVQYITDLTITAGVNDTIDFVETMSASIIAAGTVFNADYSAALTTAVASGTITAVSTLASGSVIVSGTMLGAGTTIGSGIPLVPTVSLGTNVTGVSSGTLISGSSLGAGTILGSGTVLSSGSTMGSGSIIGSGTTLTANITLGAMVSGISSGTLINGSSLRAGTILGNGTSMSSGLVIGSGTTLTTGFKVNTDITMNNSGVLSAGSFVSSGSTLNASTVLAAGEQIALTSGAGAGVIISGNGFSTLAALASGSLGVTGAYTVISGGDTLSHGVTTLTAGSILAFGTASGILASGSRLGDTQVTISSGSVLNGDMTLNGADMALTSNMTLMAGTSLAAGSVLQNGSSVDDRSITTADSVTVLMGDMTVNGSLTLNGSAGNNVLGGNLTLQAGTTLADGSILNSGSVVDNKSIITGNNIILNADMNVTGATGVVLGADITVQSGTIIAADSVLKTGSILNEDFPIDPAQTIAAGTVFPSNFGLASDTAVNSGNLAIGSTMASGSTIVAGSVLGSGSIIGSGITLTADIKVATDIAVKNSGSLNPGSFVASGSILTSGTILAAGEQIALSSGSGPGAIISGNGVLTLSALASGTIGAAGSYMVISGGDTLNNGIISLQSGSLLSFSTAAGMITSGSSLAGSKITMASGSTLNGDMAVAGDGVSLGADMTIMAGTILAENSIVAAGSILDADVATGGTSGELTATITAGNYTDMDVLCLEIKTQLENQSANNITYAVSYDPETSLFNIREDGSNLDTLDLLWGTGTHADSSIQATLGYYVIDDTLEYPQTDKAPVHCSITIDGSNDTLDFEEINGAGISSGTLKAFISHGTYTSIPDFLSTIEASMEAVSDNGIDYQVSYDSTSSTPRLTIQSSAGALNELRLFNDSDDDSIQDTLGFDLDRTGQTFYSSATPPVLMTINNENDMIDFREENIDGTLSEPVSIEIKNGDYTDLDDVALEIQTRLRSASPNKVDYIVEYDFGTGTFLIKGSDQDLASFSLLWKTGSNSSKSAAEILGFDNSKDDTMSFAESDEIVINVDIDAFNNKIDFREIVQGSEEKVVETLTASIETKTYTSYTELAQEIEEALENESHINGNGIDYSVSWDEHTNKMTIKENGTQLEELDLLWQSGENAPVSQGGTGLSIGSVLGFDGNSDDVNTPLSSTREVNWGIFNTLIDLKQYLADNDRDGLERTIGRLETNYNSMTSRIVDTGMKYNRLEVRQNITTNVNLSLTERKSAIEDADMVESIMKLQNLQIAYQAAMSSTAQVMKLSLLDYL